jgi:hypothetical protein
MIMFLLDLDNLQVTGITKEKKELSPNLILLIENGGVRPHRKVIDAELSQQIKKYEKELNSITLEVFHQLRVYNEVKKELVKLKEVRELGFL